MTNIERLLILLSLGLPLSGQGNQRGFVYGVTGNRIAATNLIRFTSSAAFGLDPSQAVSGERVNIYGRNFPAGQSNAVVVSFNGVAASVVSVGERVVTVIVPAGMTSGAVTMSVSGGAPVVVGNMRAEGVVVTPGEIELDYSQAHQFNATVVGASSQAVAWSVTDFAGGTLNVGSISSTGLYAAPPLGNPVDFPFVIQATSAQLNASGRAVVRLRCSSAPSMIANRTLVSGNLATANERHCWEFSGRTLNQVYIACVAGASVRSVTLRNRCGVAVARSGPGTRVKIVDATLDENDTYRIEVQGEQSPSGSYQLWLDQHSIQPVGVWMFPRDDVWHDPTNWSHGVLPGEHDAVVVPDFPANVRISVARAGLGCASLVSEEPIEILSGGVLRVAGRAQVNNSFVLAGGTLIGATLANGFGGESLHSTAVGSRLDAVTVLGDLWLSGGTSAGGAQAFVQIVNGITVNGTLHLNGYGPTVGFDGAQTIGGTGTILFDPFAGGAGWASLEMVNGGPLTIGPGVTLRGGHANIPARRYWGAAMHIINHGTVVADRPLEPLTFRPDGLTSLVNYGTASALSGATLAIFSSTWTNRGLISSVNSDLDFRGAWSNQGTVQMTVTTTGETRLGGTFRTADMGTLNRTGGTVKITGAVDNTGATMNLTGYWVMNGGTILGGGVVNVAGQLVLGPANRMVNVTINGDVYMSLQDASVIVENSLVLNGTLHMDGYGPTLGFQGATTVGGNCTIVLEPNGNFASLESDGPGVTLGPSVTLRGGRAWMPMRRVLGGLHLVNQGRIDVDRVNDSWVFADPNGGLNNQGILNVLANCRLEVRPGNWSNAGTMSVEPGGVLTFGGVLTNAASGVVSAGGGTVTGGTIVQDGLMSLQGTLRDLTNSGTLHVAGAGATGTLALTGSFLQTVTGTLALDLGGVTPGSQHDRVSVGGSSTLSGAVAVGLMGTFVPTLGQSFSVVAYSTNSGSFGGCNGCSLPGGRILVPTYNATELQLRVQ